MSQYRAAIIGTGRIASLLERDPLRSKPHSHAGWYRQHPAVTLVAGADIDKQRLTDFGRDWEIPDSHLFSDYRVMLERVRPDLVYDLIHALETGDEPLMSGANAIDVFTMGLALFQFDLEGHRLVTLEELDPSLRVESI
ncbi:MAG: hypothetical protein ABSH28_07945 [Acidobacteriota bacterium]|jgi:hypothetical protein